tara:strand:- start:559 stop:1014 length:456 start_codon:yes stop_codon:yes gene_type:complete
MAIATGAAVEFFGTQDTLGTSSAAVANAAFSIAGDLSTWTNGDDAVSASVTLLANFSVAPTANTSINLYLRLLDVQSTNDGTVPDANFQHTYVGSFPLNDSTVAQYITIDIGLPNSVTSQQYEFYVENSSGQSLPAGWDIYVTPKAIGPHV